MYKGQRQTTSLGIKFWCQQNGLITLPICCKFKKINLFEVWFYTYFFMFLYMYIAPGQRQTTFGDNIFMSTERPYHFAHLLKVSKSLLEIWFYTIFFFHVFMHVYSPGAEADNPLGSTFYIYVKLLSLWSLVVASIKWLSIIFPEGMHIFPYKSIRKHLTLP